MKLSMPTRPIAWIRQISSCPAAAARTQEVSADIAAEAAGAARKAVADGGDSVFEGGIG